MCKYAKSNGIVVKNAAQRATVNRIILESQNTKPAPSARKSVGNYNPNVWKVKKSS